MEVDYNLLNPNSGIVSKAEENALTKSHPALHGAIDPGLCIFETKAADMGITNVETVEYMPLASLHQTRMIEFQIPKTATYYWNLKKSYLAIRCRITTSTGAPITKDAKVGLVQAPGFSLFKSCDLTLQQRVVSPDVGNFYSMKNVLDLLLYTPQEYLESKAQSFLFYKDNAPMDSVSIESADGANNGLLTRHAYTSNGKECQLIAPLGHDCCQIESYLPSGIEVRLKLYLQDDEYLLMTEEETERYRVEITSCVLKMYGLLPTPQAIAKHNRLLSKQNAIIHYTRSVVKSYTIPTGVNSWSLNQIFADEIPFELVVCFVNTLALNGNYKKNPYNFHHHNINYIAFKAENYQTHEFKPNFANLHCAEEYNAMYDKDAPFTLHGNCVKRMDFHQGYTIFRFVIGPSMYERLARPFTGQTSLTFRMSQNLTGDSIACIVYGRFHDYLLIDGSRSVHVHS